MKQVITRKGTIVQDPPLAQMLFNDTRFSVIWLMLRIWIGYTWLSSGWGKLSNPAWMETGAALRGFWTNAVAIPETGRPAIAFDWYRSFLQFMLDAEAYVWFAKLVTFGEVLVGIALILGLFTGIAAFFGGFMNWNFIMAGSASSNGMLFAISVLLILAWKVAGYIGLDYYLLPLIGTPWEGKSIDEVEEEVIDEVEETSKAEPAHA
jgi:thiosulfate dehydrogenase (quinone) large subunit